MSDTVTCPKCGKQNVTLSYPCWNCGAKSSLATATLLGCVVVAFMQNMWVRNPAKVRASIERMHWMKRDEYRLRLIRYCLFAGCVSGRRLKAAFGGLCDEIIWEEATNEIANNPKVVLPPAPRHIECVLDEFNPDVVITFGRVASDAVAKIWPAKLIRVCHPAARQPETMAKLCAAAKELRAYVATHPKRKDVNAIR